MKCLFFAHASAVLFLTAWSLHAANYYVATDGNDSAAGSLAAPWRNIQKAANTLALGDIALVRGGIYNETVTFRASGSAKNPVTFQSYPGETAVVDGTGLSVPSAQYAAGLFEFTNASYVIVQGFELRNFRTTSASFVPAGIDITGSPHDLTFIANRVHDIANSNTSTSANAYGIAVHGTLPQAISNLVFRSNEIYSNVLGQSETFSVNGNVNGFEISGNFLHDNNNIAIGFIGYENVCSDVNQDYARNGVCRSNFVWNITSANNPTYPAGDFSADGIYSDGGSNVVIELNQIHHCDLGVELASEHKNHAAIACICRDNLIWSNNTTGISLGGYSTSVGRALNCVITHNTLYHNDTRQSGTGEIELQFSTISNIFTHNILVANSQNLFIGNQFTSNSANVVDWNLYFAPGGPNGSDWEWKKVSYASFAAWQSGTGNDAHSVFADPLFINSTNGNFHLATNSPARNSGDPGFAAASGELDIDLQPRIAGGRADLGADELNLLSPTLDIAPPTNGFVRVQLVGEPGHLFVWEQSSSLTNWQPFSTNTADTGFLALTSATIIPTRFFRARLAQ